ncbi:MAG TPA: glycosyltransferase family 1 protein [Bryobacterales bacterium]|nr:glycosyltransferase family 1 protein [Bryobacterales bacterium]
MKVALDATYSVGPALSGVGVYCSRLIEELLKAAPESRFLLCYRANRFFRALSGPRPAPNAPRRLLEEPLNVFLPRRVDLFHGLNQRLPEYRFRRALATFHDLFVLTGEYSTPEFRRRFTAFARDAAARADHIVAVSQYAAKQVEALLGVPASRITVVYHGVDPVPEFDAADLAAFRRRYGIERPFLLHVGAVQTRKNTARLVEAFETLDPALDLVLAGSDGYGASEIHARIAASPARGRIHALGYLPRAAIERLYRTATVLAFPSLEEGFGMPALEAFSAGLPVVTSNRSALAEVAGGAALLADPTDVASIAGALRRAVEDSALRAELIRKGCERAAQFRWPRAAAETLAVYRKLL